MSNNKDQKTVVGFGDEWERFDQSHLSEDEHQDLFNRYFLGFPGKNCLKIHIGLKSVTGRKYKCAGSLASLAVILLMIN